MPDSFVHLHQHTEYSMLDGAARIGDVVTSAVRDGQPAMGITDHGNMYGVLDFYKECRAQGVKPIIGSELYMAHEDRAERLQLRGSRLDDSGGEAEGGKKPYYHLTTLVENATGYRNLIQLSSRAFLEGYYRKPKVDWDLLAQHSEGLIVTTGCLGGHVLQSMMNQGFDAACEKAGRLLDIFGRDHLFVEIQDHGIPEQHRTNPELLRLARRLQLPLLATNDSHYVHQHDAVSHDALLCVQTGSLMSDPDRFKFHGDHHYLKSAAEMRALFSEVPSACDNSLWIAERCELEIEFGKPQLPNFPLPEGFSDDAEYLEHLTFAGARERWGEHLPDEAVERLAYELKVIGDMGFSSYFLIVWDLIRHAREAGIRVGPGRGSAAGCAVAYTLRITDLDPIKYDLLFERFLNPSRISMPDIDMDFDSRYRDEMIRYAAERYGRDRVAQIVTFSTIKARAAVRDAARVLGKPYIVGDRVAKAMPPLVMGRDTPLYACMEPHPKFEDGYKMAAELREMYAVDPDAKEVIDVAKGLEGLRRQDGIHAAAVVITKEPLTDYLPIQRKPESGQDPEDAPVVTQYEMHGVEELGLLKMDFLGLRNLDVITDTLELIRERRGVEVDIDDVPLDDDPTYELLRRADTIGVFQLEGTAMRALIRSLAPTEFEDVAALVALYRPGPMAANMHTDYADRKNGRQEVTYLHPDAEEILGDTYGLCLTGDTIVVDALTGRPCRLDEIDPAEGFWVQAVDEDLRPVIRQVTHWVDNGVRDTVQLTLANGMRLTGTPDHPVLTERGWVGLGELTSEDHVAVAPELVEPVLPREISPERLRILGYLLGDGSLGSGSAVAFVNRDPRLLDEFECLVAKAFPTTRPSRHLGRNGVTKVTVGNGRGNGGGPSPLLTWLRDLGLKSPPGRRPGGLLSHEKHVPPSVFECSNHQLALLLAALWDCDGHVGERLAHYRTVSPALAEDVRRILMRLGFSADVHRTHYVTGSGIERTAHQVTVYDGARFAALVAPALVSQHKRDAVFVSASRGTTVGRSDVVREVRSELTGSLRGFAAEVGVPRWHFSPYAVERHPRVHATTLAPVLDALDLPATRRRLRTDWSRVEHVEAIGPRRVYDITVEEVHNFVANGIVAHNCIYQEGIMRLAQKFAGYSLAEADNLRKACLPAGSRMLSRSRGYVPIEKVMSLADRSVQTIDERSGVSRFGEVADVWSVGVKPVYRLTTATGYSVEATADHPFLVGDRWLELGKVAPGDLVGVAGRSRTNGGSRISDAEIDLSALLISEGFTPDIRIHERSPFFCNTDPDLLDAFGHAYAARFGHGLPQRRESTVAGVTRLRLAREELLALEPVLGRLGLSADKQIPDVVLNAPLRKVERFLGLYFCADGWADRAGMHIGSKSPDVIRGLKRLLLRLGVVGNVHHRDIPGHGRHWTVSVADSGMARRLATAIEPHLTAIKHAKVSRWMAEWRDGSSATRIGIPAAFLEAEVARRQEVTGRSRRSLGVDTGSYRSCAVLHRNTVRGLVYSERLEDLATGDLLWDTVVDIEYVGEKECFDFRMADEERPYALVEDVLVHNCGKKVRELIAKERVKFVEGCEREGYGEDLGTAWFDIIEPFADYAFNKSHSYGYGFVAYQTAYLKANYPAEYLAALLTSVKTNLEKAAVYLAECRAMGIEVIVPDVNRSESDFTPVIERAEDGTETPRILFGLSAVRNVGEGLVQLIVEERTANGPFGDFYDFCQRVNTQVLNKRTIESLIKAGGFDSMGHPRQGLLTVFEQIVDTTVARRKEHDMGVMSLFGELEDGPAFDERIGIPDVEFEKKQRLTFEKEMLGLYVSDHPLLGAEQALGRKTDCTLMDLVDAEDGAHRRIGGVITNLQRKWTKKGDLMAVFTLEDLQSSVEVMVFPKTMADIGHLLADDAVVLLTGRVDKRDDTPKFIPRELELFEPLSDERPPLRLHLPPTKLTEATVDRLKELFVDFPGESEVHILLGERQVLRLPDDVLVDVRSGLVGELRALLGHEAVVI
ncbi:MAG: DNA polymerase III subunit alpha [Microthrixaceae bacterium]